MSGLPKGWVWATLGEITAPKIPQGGPRSSGTFTYIDISSIDNQRKEILDPKVLPVSEAPSRARQEVQPGDVLVSMTRPNLNAVAKVQPGLEGAIASTGFHVLRAVEVDPEWISLRVRSNDFIREMSDLVQGALYPAVRPSDVQAHRLPIPPLPEQRRIVAKIEALMARNCEVRESLTELPSMLEIFKKSIFANTFSDKNIPSYGQHDRSAFKEHPAIKEDHGIWKSKRIPVDWSWITFDKLFFDVTSQLKLPQSDYQQHGAIPVIDQGLSTRQVYSDRQNLIHPGPYPLVLFGDHTRCVKWIPDAFIQGADGVKILAPNSDLILPRLAYWVLKALELPDKGYSRHFKFLRASVFPVPPKELQQKILDQIELRMKRLDLIVGQMLDWKTHLDALEQCILFKAFRGELVPQDPNDEPAEVLLARIRAERESVPTPARRRRRPTSATDLSAAPKPAPLANVAEAVIPFAADTPARVDLETLDADALMAAFRQTLAAQAGWDSDEDLLRAVAQRFGYQRLGSRAKDTLKCHLRAALLRRIAERREDGTLALATRTLDAYTRDELVDAIPSVLRKGQALSREDLMRALIQHFGFQRLTEAMREPLRSAVNASIRRGVLQAEGSEALRRIH